LARAESSAREAGLAGVVAVVLTYRRPRLATQVVRRLVSEEGFSPAQVLLVVNGEGGLEDPHLEAAVRVHRLPGNLGPAGGFRAGLVAAAEDPAARWVYVCEDDVGLLDLPSPRVARVVREVETWPIQPVGAVVAYGRTLDRRGGTLPHLPTEDNGLEPVDVSVWGASLISTEVVRRGILPDAELFFGYEDFDFFFSLRRAGFALLVDRASARAVGDAHMTVSGRDAALSSSRPVESQEPWRYYYAARNFIPLARRYGNWRWLGWHLAYSARRVQLAHSADVSKATLAGLVDGARGRLGRNPKFVRSVGEWSGAEPVPGGEAGSGPSN
jgi:hypothetical protein